MRDPCVRITGVPARIFLVLAAFAALAPSSRASTPDWAKLAQAQTVEVLTQDEAGKPLQTTIWLVEFDGRAYIRTSRSSGWGANVVRTPNISLRIAEQDYSVRVHFIEDADLRARVSAAFRAKYGTQDAVIGIIRGRNPRIMNVVAR